MIIKEKKKKKELSHSKNGKKIERMKEELTEFFVETCVFRLES